MSITALKNYIFRSNNILRNYGVKGLSVAIQSKFKNGFVDYTLLQSLKVPPHQTGKICKPAEVQNYVSKVQPKFTEKSVLLHDELVVLTGVPYDDIGGGQRGAQLTRKALKSGRKVFYIYVYEKFDFELGVSVPSNITIQNLLHSHVDSIEAEELLSMLSSNATILIEHPHPKLLPFLKLANIRGLKTVFDLIDDWETSLGGDWFNLDIYNEFITTSKISVGSAKVLVEKLRQKGRDDALYIPNAANEDIFDKYKKYEKPADFPNYETTALYFGSLYGEWFGWDYIRETALQNPKMAIILIGDLQTKPSLPDNVIFLGAKLIDELPAYLFHSDVALLPFIPGTISDAVSPIKVFEYIFMQKPVVSTYLPEIVDYPGVFIASNPVDFAKNCQLALSANPKDEENDQFIICNSWSSRLDAIIGSEKQNPRISVVILIHNNTKIIRRSLSSFIQHNGNFLKEIIVVDNNSSDNGAEIVEKEFPSVILIKNTENGCARGRNLGAAQATGDIIAFFDSDQWLTSSTCFAEACALLDSNASIGAISWGAGWFNSFDDLRGPIVDYLPNRGMNATAQHFGYRDDVAYLATSGMFIPAQVFKATQGLDIFYDPTCFEDTDLSFQIKALGLKTVFRDLSGIRHQPHQTTQADAHSDKYKALFERNSNYFRKKWRSYPHFFTSLN